MGTGTPWWYRIPSRPLGIIVTCGFAVAIILCAPDSSTNDMVAAVLAGACVGFLVQFIQGMAKARYDERERGGRGLRNQG
ncbi:hypothetical protein ACWDBW_30130 [Streptomyces sp. NPDC001107]